jgi:anthranilate synthase component I
VQHALAPHAVLAVPIGLRVLSDQLTPVLAYRRLVAPDERTRESFLLESVEGGERQGRYSILSSRPVASVLAHATRVEVVAHDAQTPLLGPSDRTTHESADPLAIMRQLTRRVTLAPLPGAIGRELPTCVLGGWFGYVGYDSVRYAESQKLPWSDAPRDDRQLADVAMSFYDALTIFDHAAKLVHLVQLVLLRKEDDAGRAFDRASEQLRERLAQLERHSTPLPSGVLRDAAETLAAPLSSNLTQDQHAAMLARAKEYIKAGDVFQVVLGQRFERVSSADPFDVYRALRSVNPSPYMVYMQAKGCILVASSPEILCRVRREGGCFTVTNRPLAGTRKRGATPADDAALEQELRADAKERAEHIMLVDLGRNDVGRIAQPGSIALPSLLEVERYSHVMHLSSTVTGTLREGLDCWDALAATLPVGTISGAPKVRAMQIIDELEPIRRGPYGGGMGYVALDGQMDIALTLRTIVAPTALAQRDRWTYHLQAAGGIVADSVAHDEYMETVNKSMALARAIGVAEQAFGPK